LQRRASLPRPYDPSIALFLWIAGTIAFAGWNAIRAPRLLTWTLTENSLRRGKTGRDLVIQFDEIESIVVGLPGLSAPLIKLSRNYWEMVRERGKALFVRLRGGRVIQLSLSTFHYHGGEKLMKEFLRLNATKVVGFGTYSFEERKRSTWAGVNMIVKM
jgi:hypothetical protein